MSHKNSLSVYSLLKHLVLLPVYIYRWFISPMLPPSCRHTPTCSQYMIEAVQEWGPLRGMWMGLRRLSRCHPWGTHGYDPVPKKEETRPPH